MTGRAGPLGVPSVGCGWFSRPGARFRSVLRPGREVRSYHGEIDRESADHAAGTAITIGPDGCRRAGS
ncbi:hypothetical protein [Streptomyces sp. NPDC056013]|uniref:hypothetical protein n=1 Tax=Streptomyces sp. NPDC056013 TaxID=3345680 RepID=UPI0035D75E08